MAHRALRVIIGIAVVLMYSQQVTAQVVTILTFEVDGPDQLTYRPLIPETITFSLQLEETQDVEDSLTAVQLFFAESLDCKQAGIKSEPAEALPLDDPFPISVDNDDTTTRDFTATLEPDQGRCDDYLYLCVAITVASDPGNPGDHDDGIPLNPQYGGELNCTVEDNASPSAPVVDSSKAVTPVTNTTDQAEGGAVPSFSSKTLIGIGSILVMLATRLF
ncbi:uncharacterized protein [Ptychodera flava]|uniref:uncharacterized protein n=1 Tax=Ptychodera flava TaxID=63121 RepID=UPI00396AA35F